MQCLQTYIHMSFGLYLLQLGLHSKSMQQAELQTNCFGNLRTMLPIQLFDQHLQHRSLKLQFHSKSTNVAVKFQIALRGLLDQTLGNNVCLDLLDLLSGDSQMDEELSAQSFPCHFQSSVLFHSLNEQSQFHLNRNQNWRLQHLQASCSLLQLSFHLPLLCLLPLQFSNFPSIIAIELFTWILMSSPSLFVCQEIISDISRKFL